MQTIDTAAGASPIRSLRLNRRGDHAAFDAQAHGESAANAAQQAASEPLEEALQHPVVMAILANALKGSSRMKRTHVVIGLASLVGAALLASPASALNAFSPTGHLNVRSGPDFQYPVVAQMQQNVPAAVTGCIQDYSWCSVG
jgi:hypothetical protein